MTPISAPKWRRRCEPPIIAGSAPGYSPIFWWKFLRPFRWQILLRVQKIQLSFPRVAGLFLIGMFYNQFLPGGTGGDIIKSYLLLKETPDKKAGPCSRSCSTGSSVWWRSVAITVTLVSLRFDVCRKVQRRDAYSGFCSFSWAARSRPCYQFHRQWLQSFSLVAAQISRPRKIDRGFGGLSSLCAALDRDFRAFGASLAAHLATFTTFLCVAYAFNVPSRVSRRE